MRVGCRPPPLPPSQPPKHYHSLPKPRHAQNKWGVCRHRAKSKGCTNETSLLHHQHTQGVLTRGVREETQARIALENGVDAASPEEGGPAGRNGETAAAAAAGGSEGLTGGEAEASPKGKGEEGAGDEDGARVAKKKKRKKQMRRRTPGPKVRERTDGACSSYIGFCRSATGRG